MKFLFGLLLLLVIFPVSAQENRVERLPQPSSPFPQWAYWSPTGDTILVSNGKTMQLYTSDFYLLRDIRLVPEDIDADPITMTSVLFYAVWHPTGQWVLVLHNQGADIWDGTLTHKILSLWEKSIYIGPSTTWHSEKPWLAFSSYDGLINIYNFMTQMQIAKHEGNGVSVLAWLPGTDKLAFNDIDGFTVWDVVENTFVHIPLGKIADFIFNATGSYLAVLQVGNLRVFRTLDWQQIFLWDAKNSLYDLAWVDNDRVAGLENTNQLSISNIINQQTTPLYVLTDDTLEISWNVSGSKFLLITSRAEDITVRDTNTGEVLASLKAVLDGTVIAPMPPAIP